MPTQPVIEVDSAQELQRMKDVFFLVTGYSEWDLLAYNVVTRTFMTKNGGIYIVDGIYNVKWVKGPPVHVEDRESL